MNSRAMVPGDMDAVNALHDKYYEGQFERTDFMDHFMNAFVLEDNGKIVIAGGVRPVAETILVTDKSANPHVIGKALLESLAISKFTCRRFDIQLLHAFVKDENYKRHLIKHGFAPRCQALVTGV